MRNFILVFALTIVFIMFLHSPIMAQDCPNPFKSINKEGDDGNVSWHSLAILCNQSDADWFYKRQVILNSPKKQYILWPVGGIYGVVVKDQITVQTCCFPDPRLADGKLEHGYTGSKIPTKVYRGEGEPEEQLGKIDKGEEEQKQLQLGKIDKGEEEQKQKQLWISINGSTEDTDINLSIKSIFTNALLGGYKYTYRIENNGSPVILYWDILETPLPLDKGTPYLINVYTSSPYVLKGSKLEIKGSRFEVPVYTPMNLHFEPASTK